MRKQTEPPALPLPEKQAWPALIALCIGFFMILLDQTIVSVATPALQAGLDASYNEVIWVTSAYLLTFAVPLLFAGRLGDRYGQKTVYIIGMVIFTLSSLACGLATNMAMLIAARAVQGFGAALLTPQTMSVINRIFARDRRGAALGVWGVVAGLASLVGPILGGLFTETIGWQWIFFINVPIGVVSVIMVLKYVPLLEKTTRKIDPVSVVLSVLAVFLLVFGIQQGEVAHWAWWIWVCIAAGIALTVLFIFQQEKAEKRGNDPLMPLVLFKDRNFSMGNIGIFTMGFMVAGTPLPLMLFLQHVHGLSALQAGAMMIPQAVVAIVLSPMVGRAADKLSPNKLAAFGLGFSGLVYVLLGIMMGFDLPLWLFPVMVFFSGIGSAFVWSPNSTSTMRDLKPMMMGAGSGVYNTTRQLGSVLGSAVVGAVLQWRVLATDLDAAYGESVLVGGAVLFIGMAAAISANSSENAKAAMK